MNTYMVEFIPHQDGDTPVRLVCEHITLGLLVHTTLESQRQTGQRFAIIWEGGWDGGDPAAFLLDGALVSAREFGRELRDAVRAAE